MVAARPRSARFSFLGKIAAAAALIALADFLFFDRWIGASIGLFALAWAAAVVAAVPAVGRRAASLPWLVAATLFGLILIEDPSFLAWTAFWLCLSTALLLVRLGRFPNAIEMTFRLLVHWVSSAISAGADLFKLMRLLRKRRTGLRARAGMLGLPLAGGLLFLMLLASANPLIDQAFGSLRVPERVVGHIFFWGFVLLAVWPSLRPSKLVTAPWPQAPGLVPELPGVSVASVTLSLILFNAMFAVENGLDLAFLWSGAPLPQGVTLADYAHRGAYPLIATALIAGFFVLVTMRSGSDTARSPLIRRLVLLWIAQNLLLVASSMLRTIDYIEVYSLTRLRISALAWMALVALGLVLICWRLFAGRSAAWLINMNAAAAAGVLTLASVVDLGAVAANWNVRLAREVGGRGAAIDLCYLRGLGPPALLPLIELERRPLAPPLRDRVRAVRADILSEIAERQRGWRGWTWRNARRLAAAEAALGPRAPAPLPAAQGRECDGSAIPPPPPQPPASPQPGIHPAPLTQEPGR